jgi:hypothetical protein
MLAAGVPAYDVARYMGSSLRMVDAHYGHLVKGSESVHGSARCIRGEIERDCLREGATVKIVGPLVAHARVGAYSPETRNPRPSGGFL